MKRISALENAFRAKLACTTANRLARDTVTMSLANGFRLLLQTLYFIMIARTLGSQLYGEFVAILAVVGLLTPFACLGCPSLLLKAVSRDKSQLADYWGNGLALILIAGAVFSLLLSFAAVQFVGAKILLSVASLAVAELILSRIVELASFAWTALGEMRRTAWLNICISLSRLACVLLLSLVKRHPDLDDWCGAVFVGSLVCACYAFFSLNRIAGASFNLPLLRRELSEAAYFAVGTSAATVYNDIDKSMLARLSDLTSAGIYGAAYRIIDVSMSPVRAMTASAYAEFFRRGAHGSASALNYARHLIKRSSLMGLFLCLMLLLGAPLLPLILGHSFENSVEALRWLAVIPLLRSIHLFLGDALSSSGYNGRRTIVQVIVAVTNVAVNFFLIANWSWRGAAWASILCDTLLLLGFVFVFRLIKRPAQPSLPNIVLRFSSPVATED